MAKLPKLDWLSWSFAIGLPPPPYSQSYKLLSLHLVDDYQLISEVLCNLSNHMTKKSHQPNMFYSWGGVRQLLNCLPGWHKHLFEWHEGSWPNRLGVARYTTLSEDRVDIFHFQFTLNCTSGQPFQWRILAVSLPMKAYPKVILWVQFCMWANVSTWLPPPGWQACLPSLVMMTWRRSTTSLQESMSTRTPTQRRGTRISHSSPRTSLTACWSWSQSEAHPDKYDPLCFSFRLSLCYR